MSDPTGANQTTFLVSKVDQRKVSSLDLKLGIKPRSEPYEWSVLKLMSPRYGALSSRGLV